MPTDDQRLTFDIEPEVVFADTATRRIRGLALPSGAKASKGGRTWVFRKGSVKFADRTPLLKFHDPMQPVGLLKSSRWSDRGLEVDLQVSKTAAGDEVLQLASDNVLGLSIGIEVVEGGAKFVKDEVHVLSAIAPEISLTPLPAFDGASIDSVALQSDTNTGGSAMPDTATDQTGAPVTVNLDAAAATALGQAIGAAMAPPAPTTQDGGPVPQPVPTSTTTTKEPAPYRFDGGIAAHCFTRDAYHGYVQHDGEARNRLETFLAETFVATTDAAALTPLGYRPDLYVDTRAPQRVLGGLISGGTLESINPFVVPKFASATNLVNPHVEGVEPTLATFVATDETIEPHALSGKAFLTRELVDKASPAVDQMVWNKMVNASVVAAETRIATLLDAFVDAAPLALSGVDAALADDLDTTLLGVDEIERYGVLAANAALYAALATARDADGRKLFPAIAPSNADGTADGRRSLDLNGITAVQAKTLTNSYLIERGAVYQWLSSPKRLTIEIEVRGIYIGFWQYSAEAIIDDAGIHRVTYTA